MPIPAVLSYVAAYLTLIVTVAVLFRDKHSFVHGAFGVGMLLLASEELFRALSYGAVLPADAIYWQKRVLAASALIPAAWLAFSISYARFNAQKLLRQWKWVLFGVALAPVPFMGVFRKSLFAGAIYLQTA